MCLPAEEPAQEPAPAVDEAAYLDLVPAAPVHTIAEASPGSASETVVGTEEHAAAAVMTTSVRQLCHDSTLLEICFHLKTYQGTCAGAGMARHQSNGAVSPYPYDLQPVQASQDAPAEPVAEANVPEEERAQVPQPRQRADEGGWDSRAAFMPVSEVVPAAAAVAATCRSHGEYCATSARFMLADHFGSQRLGVPLNAQKPIRGLGGVSIGSVDSETSYGRDSRMAGRTRARSASAQFPGRDFDFGYRGGYKYVVPSPQIRTSRRCGFDTGESADALVWRGSCVVGVHPAAALTQLRGELPKIMQHVLIWKGDTTWFQILSFLSQCTTCLHC
ncbi:hypothetical protein FB451DRAFT_1184476 [Mycena latifolia]|nr:hypothetical protein FB451DRAFT_1184476 [Mycena latifolia]